MMELEANGTDCAAYADRTLKALVVDILRFEYATATFLRQCELHNIWVVKAPGRSGDHSLDY